MKQSLNPFRPFGPTHLSITIITFSRLSSRKKRRITKGIFMDAARRKSYEGPVWYRHLHRQKKKNRSVAVWGHFYDAGFVNSTQCPKSVVDTSILYFRRSYNQPASESIEVGKLFGRFTTAGLSIRTIYSNISSRVADLLS